jgi:Nif11 domain
MTGSSFMDFVEALKSDPALKERVQQARQEAMTNIRREADAIAAIARDAGFDMNEWAKRPTDGKSPPNESELGCLFTCCLMYTSTVEPDDLPG